MGTHEFDSGQTQNALDEFLGYRPGGRAGFFGKWRKSIDDNTGEAKVALHTKRKPIILYQHQGIPRVVNREKDGAEVEELWGGQHNCYEQEAVIDKQYAYDTQGRREVVPDNCSHCRLNWKVAELVKLSEKERISASRAKRPMDMSIGIPFWTPLFRFSAQDSREDQVVHAGPMVQEVPDWDDLSGEVREAVKHSGLKLKAAWSQNNYARKQALFILVGVVGGPDADLTAQDGISVAIERGMLFDRFQREVAAAWKRKQTGKNVSPEARKRGDGDPWRVPYPFHFEYDKKAEIKDMYKVTALEEPISPDVMALITGPVPDISKHLRKFDQAKLRLFLEANAQTDLLPFDEIFGRWDAGKKLWIPLESEQEDEGDDSFPHGANVAPEVGRGTFEEATRAAETPKEAAPLSAQRPAAKEKPTKATSGLAFPPGKPEDYGDDDESVILCWDEVKGCKKLMWSEDHTCPHCGVIWDQAKADAEKKAKEAEAKKAKPAEEVPKKGRARARPSAAPEPSTPPAQPVGKSDDVGF